MAGTLTISTLSDGTNSTSSTNCIQGSAKAWAQFNGQPATPTIRASYNVSSVTKSSTGTFLVNFTNAFADTNYCGLYTPGNGTEAAYFTMMDIVSSSSAKVVNYNGSARVDTLYNSVSFFR